MKKVENHKGEKSHMAGSERMKNILISQMRKHLAPYKKVLEIGVATGGFAVPLSKRVKKVYACDFSKALLEKGKQGVLEKNLVHIDFQVQDPYNLLYENEEFDVVIISNCLYRVKEPEQLLREARRVLKNEGVLIAPGYVLASSKLEQTIWKLYHNTLEDRCYHIWSGLTYRGLFESCQFQIIQSGLINAPLKMQYLVAKKIL